MWLGLGLSATEGYTLLLKARLAVGAQRMFSRNAKVPSGTTISPGCLLRRNQQLGSFVVGRSDPAQFFRAPSGRSLTTKGGDLSRRPQQVVQQRHGVTQAGSFNAVLVQERLPLMQLGSVFGELLGQCQGPLMGKGGLPPGEGGGDDCGRWRSGSPRRRGRSPASPRPWSAGAGCHTKEQGALEQESHRLLYDCIYPSIHTFIQSYRLCQQLLFFLKRVGQGRPPLPLVLLVNSSYKGLTLSQSMRIHKAAPETGGQQQTKTRWLLLAWIDQRWIRI